MRALALALVLVAASSAQAGRIGAGKLNGHAVLTSGAVADGVLTPGAADQFGCGDPPVAGYNLWLDGSDPDGDTVYGDTTAGANALTTWVDKGSINDDPTNATAGQRPDIKGNCPGPGNFCALFDGTDDALFATSSAAWDFTNSGTDYNFFALVRSAATSGRHVILDTGKEQGSGNAGRTVSQTRVEPQVRLRGGNAGVVDPSITSGGTLFTSDLWHVVEVACDFDNLCQTLVDGVVELSDSSLTPANYGDPVTFAGTIGRDASTGDRYWDGEMAQILEYPSVLTNEERADIRTWMGAIKNGDCVFRDPPPPPALSPPPVAGFTHWWDARDPDGDGSGDDTSAVDLTTWVGKGSAAKDLTQATSSLKPTVTASCTGGSGDDEWCLDWDGGDYITAALASDWDFLNDGATDTTTAFLIRWTSGNGPHFDTGHYLSNAGDGYCLWRFEGATNALRVQAGDSPTFDTQINAPVGTSVSGQWYSVIVTCDISSSCTLHVDDTLQGTDASVGGASGGSSFPLRLGARADTAASFFSGRISQITVWQSALSAGDRTDVFDWHDGIVGGVL